MYLSAQVDKFVFRLIAVRVGDPANLLCVSKPIYSVLQADHYEQEWFSRWHSTYCPYRPWQYAAVSWRRLHGASAEQLVSWMLCYLAWATQQRELPGPGNPGRRQPEQAPDAYTTAAPGNGATPGAHRKLLSHEGRFTPFPACWPSTATVRDAKQLLQKGRAVDALLKLCPDRALLMPYAAKAQNASLLQELLTAARIRKNSHLRGSIGFPVEWVSHSSINTYFYTQLIVCYQALSAGNPHILQTLLMISSHWTFPQTHKKLLKHAARHSNAACIKALLAWDTPNSSQVDSHHLAMAAYRTDPWAAEAVAVLLEVLEAEQRLNSSSMRAVYTAACISGNWHVLQLLVMYAAAAPQQQLPVLLKAAVVAGNLPVLQQLLRVPNDSCSSAAVGPNNADVSGCMSSRSASDRINPADDQAAATAAATAAAADGQAAAADGQVAADSQVAAEGQAAAAAAAANGPQQSAQPELIPGLPSLDWSSLTPSHIKGLLQAALKHTTGLEKHWQNPFSSSTPDQLFSDSSRATATAYVYERQQQQQQLVMADILWRLLVEGQGRTAEVVEYITSEDEPWLKIAYTLLQQVPNHLNFVDIFAWLQQHQLAEQKKHQLIEYEAYKSAMHCWILDQELLSKAADAGDFQQALQLLQLVKQSSGSSVCDLPLLKTPHVLVSILGGHLRRAAAAGDGTAVAQIDKLAAICCFLFSKEVVAAEAQAVGAGTNSTTAADDAAIPELSLEMTADDIAHVQEQIAAAAAAAAAASSSMFRDFKQPWLLKPTRMTHFSLGHTVLNQPMSEPVQLILQLGIPADLLGSLFKLKADMLAAYILDVDQQASDTEAEAAAAAAAVATQKEAAAAVVLQILHPLYLGLDRHLSEVQWLQSRVRDLRINCMVLNHFPDLQKHCQPQAAERNDVRTSLACGDRSSTDDSSELLERRYNTDTVTLSTPLHQSLHALLSARPPRKRIAAAAASLRGSNAATGHQPGVLPLWQQCLLVVAAQTEFEAQQFKLLHDPGAYMSAAVYSTAAAGAADVSCSSSSSSSSAVTAVQQLLSGSKPVPSRVSATVDSDGMHPWVEDLAAAAVETGDDKLLKEILAGEVGEKVSDAEIPGAPSALVEALVTAHCTPIRNRATARPTQHQQDMLDLQQWQLDPSSSSSSSHCAAGPRFARSAADSALLVLTQTPSDPDLLCMWLRAAIRPAATKPDLERAKAVLAAVAAAQAMPAGAKLCTREAFGKVRDSGDLDLIAIYMCWLDRLESQPEPDDEDEAAVAAAEDAMLDAGFVGALDPAELPWQGGDGELLPVLMPGDDGEIDDDL